MTSPIIASRTIACSLELFVPDHQFDVCGALGHEAMAGDEPCHGTNAHDAKDEDDNKDSGDRFEAKHVSAGDVCNVRFYTYGRR